MWGVVSVRLSWMQPLEFARADGLMWCIFISRPRHHRPLVLFFVCIGFGEINDRVGNFNDSLGRT